MKRFTIRRPRYNTVYLLVCCILFFATGFFILTLGALAHVNPNISFTSLFQWEPVRNLIYSIALSF